MKTWERFGECVDKLRVIPRALLLLYTWQAWRVAEWAMSLHDLTGGQAAFVSTVWGVYPLLLNFYMANGTDWQRNKTTSTATVTTTGPP